MLRRYIHFTHLLIISLIFTTMNMGYVYGQDLAIRIDSLISSDFYKHALIGVSVRDVDNGTIIYDHEGQKMRIPASTLKLLTHIAAKDILGGDFRFKTTISHDGQIDTNGILQGNIYITAGGDPTLGSSRIPGVMGMDQLLATILDDIRRVGITRVDGDVIVETQGYESQSFVPSWQWDDVGNYYGSGTWALNITENDYSVYLYRDGAVGEMTRLSHVSPSIPGLQIDNLVTIDSANADDNSNIFIGSNENQRQIVGKIPQGKTTYAIKGAIPNPPLYFGYKVHEILSQNGMGTQKYTVKPYSTGFPLERTPIQIYQSPTLDLIIKYADMWSVNLYSEAILKAVAKEKSGYGSTSLGISKIVNFYKDRGLDIESFYMVDGSGLSTRSLVTPDFMTHALYYAAQQNSFESMTALIPMAGVEGTVRSLLANSTAKGYVWAKSGSMSKITCYAGYCKTRSGKKLAFSILLNASHHRSVRQNRRQLEKIIESMFQFA
jgi:serine-type D-Ala-D-Ala carboxypeptidase/endopeptidase (penicillin-binding protein 4)